MDLTLNPHAIPDAPFAIAFSGGGDSTALIHALRDTRPFVFIVDHGLRVGSAQEAKEAQATAQSFGLTARILTWSPPTIGAGLQAKARQARYALLGEACRAVGVKHLLTGHTQDDQCETVLMRLKAGGSWRGAAAMRAVTPSPLWPELAEIMLCRPMLGVSRENVRHYLKAHALRFIDDPSNENRDFARIRARDELRARPVLRTDMLNLSGEMQTARAQELNMMKHDFDRHVTVDDFGLIYLNAAVKPYLLTVLISAAAGTGERPRGQAVMRLCSAMHAPDFSGASLGGAHISPHKSAWSIRRDAVIATGRGGVPALPPQSFSGRTLWDGRFWIDGEGELAPCGQAWFDAPPPLKTAIMSCPAKARATLPLWTRAGQIIAIGPYGVDGQRHDGVKSAVLTRLEREFSSYSV